jgi:putative peptide zinc metalloprotease protein
VISPPAQNPKLLSLREDIRLINDAPGQAGEPRWLIHDPVRDTFFEIGLEAFQLMSLWPKAATAAELVKIVQSAHARAVTEDEVVEFNRFLAHSRLTEEAAGGWHELSHASTASSQSLAQQALHNYLFFKIPLMQPSEFLQRSLPAVRFLAGRWFFIAFTLLATVGLFFASRQWGDMMDGLHRQLTLSGAMLFAVTLFIMKIFHELGHAYVATAMGCRVRSMGLAVMLMAPMLYTDVTEAWRLPERKKRMAIDLAGVAVEMVIAGLALFAWAFLPPGDSRDVALVIATAAVMMTLAVNLSPFMRFDGYYVFADLIGVKNLQPRAFALVRWKLREWLFGLGVSCPDTLRGGLRSLVIAYGFVTMLYRLVLFTGIAIIVYHATFKALGIILFLVEIIIFVARPVWRELKVWWSLRAAAATNPRAWLSLTALGACLLFFAVPWSTQVSVHAILEPARFVRIYPSAPAEIQRIFVAAGQSVKVGDLLITLGSPRLEKELSVTQAKLALVEERMGRRLGDGKDQAASLTLAKDRLSLIEKTTALKRQIESLSIHAAIDGRIAELDPHLHPGRLVSRDDELGIVVAGNDGVIRGYADQQDLWRLKAGGKARFIPDDSQVPSLNAAVASVAISASTMIDIPHLAETHGGKVRAHPPQQKSGLVPLDPIHLVTLDLSATFAPVRPVRGVALVEGAPQSIAASFFRRVLQVLVQEVGA